MSAVATSEQCGDENKVWLSLSEELLQLMRNEMKRKERKINYLENHVEDFPSFSTKLLFKDVKQSLDARKAEFGEFETFVANMRALDDKFDAIVNDFDGAPTLNAMKEQSVNRQRESFSRQVLLSSQTVREAVSTLQVSTVHRNGTINSNESETNTFGSTYEQRAIMYEPYPQTASRGSSAKDGNYEAYIKVEQESNEESGLNDGDESYASTDQTEETQNVSTVDVMFTPQSQYDEESNPETSQTPESGKKATVVCCICNAKKQYVTPRKRFGKSTCDSCFFFFWRFTRNPRQLYCRHQGVCKIEGQKRNSINRCLACWLSTCLDKFELSEKMRNFITSKYPPKIQVVNSQNKANHVYKVRRVQAY